jgi:Domain of unknown function (DUF4129)
MSQQRSGARDGGAARGWRQGRLALAACLLALAAVGLRGIVPRPALAGSFRHDGLLIAVAAEAVLACLMAALLVRRSRAPDDAIIAARLRRILTYIVGITLVAIPVGYVLDVSAHVHLAPRPVQRGGTRPGSAPVRPPPHSHLVNDRIVTVILLALVAAALIYVIARFIATHRGTWTGWRRRARSASIEPAGDADEDSLREAVESGQSALRLLDDARTAIIACYAAMEQTLARAGAARAAADTPYELLLRAADRGLVRTDAATRLTTLFYEARFSSHPMPSARRDDARRALNELAASLAEPEPTAGTGAGG